MTKDKINKKIKANLSKLIDELNGRAAPTNFMAESLIANTLEILLIRVNHPKN